MVEFLGNIRSIKINDYYYVNELLTREIRKPSDSIKQWSDKK